MSASWEKLTVAPALLEMLQRSGITQPTSVQEEAIPAILEGKDVSARSQTGSGKTLAFLLPVLQRIDTAITNVQAIVIAPTQELAMQIVRVAETYGEPLGVRVQSLIGGAAVKRQLEGLKRRPQLVIGTPGRIHELLHTKKLKLHEVAIVIVDEADQVFDLGSSKEVETVLKATKRERQIAFFSATYPKVMADLESRWMSDPLRIAITPEHLVAESIKNYFLLCEAREKTDTVRRLLRLLEPSSALLFLNDTDNVANWESKLGFEGFTVETLYGDADKIQRARTLARFRDGSCQVLLATDVAARGLDIVGLPLVINLDPPVDADHYVHRAGRTGRMGREGTVVSIITPPELFIMVKFRKQLGIDLPEKAMYRGKLVDPAEVNNNPAASNRRQTSEESKPRPGEKERHRSVEPKDGGKAPSGTGVKARPKASPAKSKPSAKSKAERKNKGAPKWLKAKREGDDGNK